MEICFTLNILHVAVDVKQLIRLQQSIVPHSWQSIHVPKTALSWHLNGIPVEILHSTEVKVVPLLL